MLLLHQGTAGRLAGGGAGVPQAKDIIEAIDGVTGDLKWRHRRDPPDDLYDLRAHDGDEDLTALAPELRPSRGNNLFVFALP